MHLGRGWQAYSIVGANKCNVTHTGFVILYYRNPSWDTSCHEIRYHKLALGSHQGRSSRLQGSWLFLGIIGLMIV